MSDQLLYIFCSDDSVREGGEGDKKLLYKVVMRTGTWKLRPGPGGVKLKEPLKILRDKAPKGHISLTALKQNFEAGAKENVTFPTVHADGTISDSGFIRKLVIEDVKDDKGNVTASKLWAAIDVTDSEVNRKVKEKSLVGCSGGVLFDYERTEDGKKFDQVLSHVMGTNSPWINGCDGYKDKLPENVMASETAEAMPFGELEMESETVEEIKLDAPPADDYVKPAEGTVVWKPEDGFRRRQHLVQKALDDWRRSIMASFPRDSYAYDDFPYMHCEDVTDDGTSQRALIKSGYGDDADSWVAAFALQEEVAVIKPFATWTPAKKEWVAASEETESKDSAPSAGRRRPAPLSRTGISLTEDETGLRRAQRLRHARSEQHHSPNNLSGGTMKLSELLVREGVELSDETRAAIAAEEAEQAVKDARYAKIENDAKEDRIKTFLGDLDKLDPESKLFTPGWRKKARDFMLSDDGGTALMFSETTESGAKTTPVELSATQIIRDLVDAFPKTEEGKLAFGEIIKKTPGDAKPAEDHEEEKPKGSQAQALLAEDPMFADFTGRKPETNGKVA